MTTTQDCSKRLNMFIVAIVKKNDYYSRLLKKIGHVCCWHCKKNDYSKTYFV